MPNRRAFTLVELLVVVAIIAVMAAILFPVLTQAKLQATHISWSEHGRQVGLGTQLYLGDYDDMMPLARHNFDRSAGASNDKTWVQAILPYTRNFDMFFCPVDGTRTPRRFPFDPDLAPGDPINRYYLDSQRVNFGYNFTYLAPVTRNATRWVNTPRAVNQVDNPSETILFGDSAWEVNQGRASGGGNFLIIPPCRYEQTASGSILDTFELNSLPKDEILGNGSDWQSSGDAWRGDAGGLYPWFERTITVINVDGRVDRIPLRRITAGCDVRPGWEGYIVNRPLYIWDLR
jgi:prepilin-type N-terminal cleavage/methylation domain-containing protein